MLGKYTQPIIYMLVLTASVQVYFVGFNFQKNTWVDSSSLLSVYVDDTKNTPEPHTDINWRDQNSKIPYYHALTAATVAHRVQAVADNALVDTRSLPTQRCDEDISPCDFILTGNAILVSWNPNSIHIKRTGPGEIKLNMNQANGWLVNGIKGFPNQKTVESNSTFMIQDDNNDAYTLTYFPL
jgi:hypothetical protein